MEAVGRSKYMGITGNQHPGGSSTSEILGDPHQDRDREGGGFSERNSQKVGGGDKIGQLGKKATADEGTPRGRRGSPGKELL